jgi:hypothetical protein
MTTSPGSNDTQLQTLLATALEHNKHALTFLGGRICYANTRITQAYWRRFPSFPYMGPTPRIRDAEYFEAMRSIIMVLENARGPKLRLAMARRLQAAAFATGYIEEAMAFAPQIAWFEKRAK